MDECQDREELAARALESLWKSRQLTEDARDARKAFATGDRRATSMRDRRPAAGDALIHHSHPAHHVTDEGHPEILSRLDAALAVADTAALVSCFASGMEANSEEE